MRLSPAFQALAPDWVGCDVYTTVRSNLRPILPVRVSLVSCVGLAPPQLASGPAGILIISCSPPLCGTSILPRVIAGDILGCFFAVLSAYSLPHFSTRSLMNYYVKSMSATLMLAVLSSTCAAQACNSTVLTVKDWSVIEAGTQTGRLETIIQSNASQKTNRDKRFDRF